MTKTKDVCRMIVRDSDKDKPMIHARLMQIMYLADQKHIEKHGKSITGIKWEITAFGVFSMDVHSIIRRDRHLHVEKTRSQYDKPLSVIRQKDQKRSMRVRIEPGQEETLSETINHVNQLTWSETMNLVRHMVNQRGGRW